MKLNITICTLFVLCILITNVLKAQENSADIVGWQNLDLKSDSFFGISTQKAYEHLLKNKPHVPVTVAVIDGGIDIQHEDLKKVIWVNPGEIAFDNNDNDKNGYIDDANGWDFIGSAKGDVQYDNLELTRQVRTYASYFSNMDTVSLTGSNAIDFKRYQVMRTELATKLEAAKTTYERILRVSNTLDNLMARVQNSNATSADFKKLKPQSDFEAFVLNVLVKNIANYKSAAEFKSKEVDEPLKHYKSQIDYHYNIAFDPRSIVGDNYNNSSERYYGNSDVDGPTDDHGTHVAGIIGAVRDNNIGIMGIANDVQIMSVRAVPDGDERDKDVANAIRYAAANGAKVINMSFGRYYTSDKKAVDDAIKFAMTKDVLLIHAAGNDNKNTDNEPHYPNKTYLDGGVANAWIEVGASGQKDDETLKAFFSNYGKKTVDVFAPGMDIYSTTPKSTYTAHSGTSMAAPVVVGLAALIRSYYPKLTALQVKDIIIKTVTKVNHAVNVADKDKKISIPFSTLCASGGVVNAYNALALAATY